MAPIGAEDMFAQIVGIGEVAIVGHADAIGAVYIERLSQCWARAAGCWVAYMTYAYLAHQSHHMAAAENIPGQPFALALMQLAVFFSDYTGGVLAAMLQHGQRIVEP